MLASLWTKKNWIFFKKIKIEYTFVCLLWHGKQKYGKIFFILWKLLGIIILYSFVSFYFKMNKFKWLLFIAIIPPPYDTIPVFNVPIYTVLSIFEENQFLMYRL